MKISRSGVAFLFGALAAALAGCDAGEKCGPGTVEVDGACVPSGGEECGPGTVERDGECVPDGSVICETGTTFNPDTGTCVPDITGCAPGTVLVEGECVPEGEVREADVEEAMEPNDGQLLGDGAAQLALPAVGETVLLHGCIEPYRDEVNEDGDPDPDGERDPDLDAFVFEAERPTLLDITIDGVGGAAGGFQVVADGPLASDGWVRFGVNLTGDTTRQQVFLPVAGTYVFLAADSRSVLTKLAAGGPDACYFATVANLEIPTGTLLSSPDGDADLAGEIQFWRFEPEADGQVIQTRVDYSSSSAAVALVQLVNGEYRGSTRFGGIGNPVLASQISGIAEGDDVLLLVEPITNYSLTPVSTTLRVTDVPTTPLPAAGASIELTHHEDDPFRLVFFRADAGDVLHLRFSGDGEAEHEVHVFEPGVTSFDPGDQQFIATPCLECTSADSWIQVQRTGFYYLAISKLGADDGETYRVTLDVGADRPVSLVLDQSEPATLAAGERAFFEIDLNRLIWLDYLFNSDTLAGASIRFYPRDASGALDQTVLEVDAEQARAGQAFGRIVAGLGGTLLVSVDAGAAGGRMSFLVTQKSFVNAGTVDDDSPVSRPISVAGGRSALVFLRAAPDASVRVSVTGAEGDDLRLEQLDREEVALYERNQGAAGDPEDLARVVDGDGFLAVRVSSSGADDVTFDARLVVLGESEGENDPVRAIPDNDGAGVVDSIALDEPCAIASIEVQVNITHPFRGEIELTLTSPEGTAVRLKDNEIFDPADNVTGTFPTTLQPAESLDALLAEEARGTWRLSVVDGGQGDVGIFNFWRVSVVCM